MLVKIYVLSILCLIASTIALPFIPDSSDGVNAIKIDLDKNKPEKVVEERNEYYEDKEKDVEKTNIQDISDSFVENSKEKDSKEQEKDKVDKFNDRFSEDIKEKRDDHNDREKGKDKEKVEEKTDFQVYLGPFADNSEVKDSKENNDEIDNARFPEESEEKIKVNEDKNIGKDNEKSDFQVFWDPYAVNSKRKKSKKEKKNKHNKHIGHSNPANYESEYSYYQLDVDFKDNKVKVYPDIMFDDYPIGWWPEPSYEFLSFLDYVTSPYYLPKPYWPFQFKPKYRRRRPSVPYEKRKNVF